MTTTCPCGSGRPYDDCCEPLINGSRPATTAEELMRSRYSAYTKAEIAYILNTTHPNHRGDFDEKGSREWAENSVWEGLEIRNTWGGSAEESEGKVEFIATYRDKGVRRTHHELAEFKKEGGSWYFVDGVGIKPEPLKSDKVGRNEPCPCGSGQKYKKCCGK